MPSINRRTFVAATAGSSLALALPAGAAETKAAPPAAQKTIGPLLGHVEPTKAIVWYRAAAPGNYELRVTGPSKDETQTLAGTASPEHDLCLTWTVENLQPGKEYQAAVHAADTQKAMPAKPAVIRTPPPLDQPARVTLCCGSCASSDKFFDIWDRMATVGADALVLLGDTPYIDKTDLASNRAAHRKFLSIPNLVELARTRPLWATWDDHDFGGNDSDGKKMEKVKPQLRQAFIEYRGLNSYGDGKEGIYTNFRYGPVEMFLLDPRYFSQCEPSPVDPKKPTCLGKQQWEWLLAGLAASTAPFKIIASGQIWDDKKNKEKDDWETYSSERDALYDYLGKKKITGVVLMSGDIHVSRRLRYPLKERVGYDLEQWIISPLHDRIIPSLNIPHPALLWGEAIPNVFLQIVADTTTATPTLTANWYTREGTLVHHITLTGNTLLPSAS